MKNSVYTFLLCILSISAFGQSDSLLQAGRFVNITEFGVAFGRAPAYQYYPVYYDYIVWPGPYPYPGASLEKKNVQNWTISSFNGFRLKPKTLLGLTVGLDNYTQDLMLPLSLGLRQTLLQKQKSEGASLFASADLGYGFSLAKVKDDEYADKKGGWMLNPGIGIRLPMKNGAAIVFTAGYKRQASRVKYDYPEEYQLARQDKATRHRFVLRAGFAF
ncbi:hypothetical protein LAG90_03090 [Marinilongibacter aquaticus]|uniref:hypothetical protein n=1 Tax=Marinilongibacter aquaticus TaxID=2975157 RepID=UPI0021BD9D01|nr:hypothetical protein [Marinilongibacter aquaticus]UBM59636.1 hypothetical protein LAG90_03090 [Marinilongibacter aquaticus]